MGTIPIIYQILFAVVAVIAAIALALFMAWIFRKDNSLKKGANR